jgi:hypothetical protein
MKSRNPIYLISTLSNNKTTLVAGIHPQLTNLITLLNLTLVSLDPSLDPERLSTIIADSSQRFFNDNKLCQGFFQWQQSCSAFSVSKRGVDNVCKYILNQKEHHKTIDYAQEL